MYRCASEGSGSFWKVLFPSCSEHLFACWLSLRFIQQAPGNQITITNSTCTVVVRTIALSSAAHTLRTRMLPTEQGLLYMFDMDLDVRKQCGFGWSIRNKEKLQHPGRKYQNIRFHLGKPVEC